MQVVALKGWAVTHKAGDEETDYKFHRSSKLAAGEEAVVREGNSYIEPNLASVICLTYARSLNVDLEC